MVAKPKDGSFGLRLCVPGPGDPVMGAHSARSHRTNCSMASKTMKFELLGRRRDAPTASSPGSRRVSTPPYRNPGYKPSDDAYLYRALDKLGNTIDFYLSATRNTKAAKRFLGKALRGMKDWELPEVLNTDKAPTYS